MHSATIIVTPISNYPPRTHLFPQKIQISPPQFIAAAQPSRKIAFLGGLASKISAVGDHSGAGSQTLAEYMGKGGANVGDELVVLFTHLAYACKKIAALVASPLSSNLGKSSDAGAGSAERDEPKPLDIVANEIVLSSLKNSGKVAVMASEEDEAPVWLADDGPLLLCWILLMKLEELDHLPLEEKALLNSLQSGTKLIASGYVLYSSAMLLCASFGSGTHGFTLDHSTGDFILTHPDIKIPPRGQIYSVNDARYFDWPEGLRRYIDTVRQGKGKHPKKYSARYICSLVADFHRTLLYGGIAMNPRDHLRLVYEANPLSFLAEQAGGKGSDGKVRILSLQPVKLHQRLPLFFGSPDDIDELESYGDVQQKVNPGYDV
ncbi:hypothetical protein SASPL_119596 [Salvia splendens]|uniref:fructose-bisphosphatase n=1 Tax=Salvia splendens TaxID=180675 RepID=A0A4D9BY13_SALSN|nr:hypothetical protein SASPL_119596 [Salvia splendens]